MLAETLPQVLEGIQVGPQCGKEGLVLALDLTTPPSKIGPPKIHHRAYRLCGRNARERSHCPLQGQRLPEQNLFCSQKRDHKTESHPGHVHPQQSNSMPLIPDDNHPSSLPEHATQSLAHFHRPFRSLLAHSHREVTSKIPDVCNW